MFARMPLRHRARHEWVTNNFHFLALVQQAVVSTDVVTRRYFAVN